MSTSFVSNQPKFYDNQMNSNENDPKKRKTPEEGYSREENFQSNIDNREQKKPKMINLLAEVATERIEIDDEVRDLAIGVDTAFMSEMERLKDAVVHPRCGNVFSEKEVNNWYENKKTTFCRGCDENKKNVQESSFKPVPNLREIAKSFFSRGIGLEISDIKDKDAALQYLREAERFFFQKKYIEAIEKCDLGLDVKCKEEKINQDLNKCKKESRLELFSIFFEVGNKAYVGFQMNEGKNYGAEALCMNAIKAYEKASSFVEDCNTLQKIELFLKMGRCNISFGNVLGLQKKYEEAEKQFGNAINLFNKALDMETRPPMKIHIILDCHEFVYENYKKILVHQKKYEEIEKIFSDMIDLYKKALDMENNNTEKKIEILKKIGIIYSACGDIFTFKKEYEKAEKVICDAIDAYNKVFDLETDPEKKTLILRTLGKYYHSYAITLRSQNKNIEFEKSICDAIEAYTKGLDTTKTLLTKIELLDKIANCFSMYGTFLFNQKIYPKSKKSYSNAIDAYNKELLLIDNEYQKNQILNLLRDDFQRKANSYIRMNQYAKARSTILSALDLKCSDKNKENELVEMLVNCNNKIVSQSKEEEK